MEVRASCELARNKTVARIAWLPSEECSERGERSRKEETGEAEKN